MHVSAALFLDQMKLAQELLGEDVVKRAMTRLRPEERAEIEACLPVSWISLQTSTAFFYAVARESGQDPVEWHRKATRIGIEKTFTTMWRFLTRLVSVEALCKRVPPLFAHSYDTGQMTAEVVGEGHIVAIVSGWPQIPEFEIDAIVSGIEVLLRVADKRSVNTLWRRLPDGARFDIYYQ